MTLRSRLRAVVRRAVLGTLTAALLSSPTAAAAAQGSEETIQMSWDGRSYADQTVESFVGAPVVVPGDQDSSTLIVRNEGPTAGVLRATISNVQMGSVSRAADNDDFYDDLSVRWDSGQNSVTDLAANGDTPVMRTRLEQGETAKLTIGYELPLEVTSGNRTEVGKRSASFDVILTLGGELPEAAESRSAEPTSGDRAVGENSEAGSDWFTPVRPGPGFLAETGMNLLWLAVLGILAVSVGGMMRRAAAKHGREQRQQ